MATVCIGTSGWSYPKGEGTWTGHFYPKGKIVELEYYAQFFNTVEVNSSFYRPPDQNMVRNWVRRTPPDFLFAVKLWQKFTHPKMYKEAIGEDAVVLQGDIDQFLNGLEPLIDAGKLGTLLAQFPASFKNDEHGKRILSTLIGVFGRYRLAVELRHRSWSDDEATARLLRDSNVTWVQIDEPRFKSSVAQELPLTSDMAYFRFHGRNAEMWWKGDSETRYRYLYSPEEIGQLSARVQSASEQTIMLFAFFNNHWQGYAPRNAVDLKRNMGVPVVELPKPA